MRSSPSRRTPGPGPACWSGPSPGCCTRWTEPRPRPVSGPGSSRLSWSWWSSSWSWSPCSTAAGCACRSRTPRRAGPSWAAASRAAPSIDSARRRRRPPGATSWRCASSCGPSRAAWTSAGLVDPRPGRTADELAAEAGPDPSRARCRPAHRSPHVRRRRLRLGARLGRPGRAASPPRRAGRGQPAGPAGRRSAMTQVLDRPETAAAPPAAAGQRLRRAAWPIAIAGLVLAAVLVTVWANGRGNDQPLDPDGVSPDGSKALAQVLRTHGVPVQVARSASTLPDGPRGPPHSHRAGQSHRPARRRPTSPRCGPMSLARPPPGGSSWSRPGRGSSPRSCPAWGSLG